MGMLKTFFDDVFAQPRTAPPAVRPRAASLGDATEAELEAHLKISRYGDFTLTDAIRPSLSLEVVPAAGYRHDVYRDPETKAEVPVLMASASREHLMELFIELIQPLGQTVDVVLETSHGHRAGQHTDLYREQIDMPILESVLWDFEHLLTNDGCTGIAVLNPSIPMEVQLDEHKLLIMYGAHLDEHEEILHHGGIDCHDDMRFITEAEHVHSTNERFIEDFEELKFRLGMDSE